MNEQVQSPSAIPFFEKDDGELNIVQVKLIDFLHKHGFGKVYVESEMSSSLVRVEEGIVHRTSKERIRDFVMETVRCVPDDGVPKGFSKKDFEDLLIRTSHIYFGSDFVTNLPRLDIEFNRDTREEAFFYFENGFVNVTASRYELRPYEELDGAIWADQIIPREFEPIRDDEPLVESHWFQFLNNVMGGGTARTECAVDRARIPPARLQGPGKREGNCLSRRGNLRCAKRQDGKVPRGRGPPEARSSVSHRCT